jgi:hypothetical protein
VDAFRGAEARLFHVAALISFIITFRFVISDSTLGFSEEIRIIYEQSDEAIIWH